MTEPDGATTLDQDEKEGLLFPHIGIRSELDQMEQVNIQQGLIWLRRKQISIDDLLSDYFVRLLHKKLFGDVWVWAGTYRLTEKNLGIAPEQIAVQLRLLVDDVQFWIQAKTFPDKELAIRFHHRLVYIHPFPNGNGRHSRIMADAVLTKLLSVPPIDWDGDKLSKTGGVRSKYIQALRKADKGDFSDLIGLYC